jgi:hypothetical protein
LHNSCLGVDGLIGMDVLAGRILTIDARALVIVPATTL